INPPQWLIFGYIPIIISLGVHYVPYFFIMMRGALANIDSRLEESAELLQASKLEILMKITLPMVLPAIGAGFILTFSKGLGEFGTQAFLGLPIRYYTFSTRIYSALNNQLYGEGYVLALILIISTTFIVILNQMVIGTRKRYVTISGKGSVKKQIELGKWRIPATVMILAFIVIFVFGPLLLLGIQTVMKTEGIYSLDNFTLHYWFGGSDPDMAMGQPGIFQNSVIKDAIWNSLRLSGLAALISGFVGILIGYTVVKGRKTILAKLIENLTFAPYLIPGVAFGGIYLTMFAKKFGPIPSLYGTFALLVIVCIVKHLPFSSSAGITAMHQIDPSLEEVAVVHGIGWGTRFRKIIFPLAKGGVLSAMLLNFITTMRTLDLVILLVTPNTTLMTSVIFRYSQQGFVQHSYGVMILIIFIVISGHLILSKIGGKVEL
ncbi:MAG: iron ABC transporter permease, partial [Spirochaetales bacterium]|nr:iron ABC transporter permease [Spirochaetales bacterium]